MGVLILELKLFPSDEMIYARNVRMMIWQKHDSSISSGKNIMDCNLSRHYFTGVHEFIALNRSLNQLKRDGGCRVVNYCSC
jgi:hypothetical protein